MCVGAKHLSPKPHSGDADKGENFFAPTSIDTGGGTKDPQHGNIMLGADFGQLFCFYCECVHVAPLAGILYFPPFAFTKRIFNSYTTRLINSCSSLFRLPLVFSSSMAKVSMA